MATCWAIIGRFAPVLLMCWGATTLPLNCARDTGETTTGKAPLAFTRVTIAVMLSWKFCAVLVLSLCPNCSSTQSPVCSRDSIAPNSAPLARKLAELSPESA